MEKLTEMSIRYLRAKVTAGADVVQLFDSWIGALSRRDYEEFVAPYSDRILASLEAPTIHFGTGTSHLLDSIQSIAGDVIGVDWRTPIDAVSRERGVQGNLDPALLLGPWSRAEEETREILALAEGRPGHIFNLGHGVLPDTDPADLGRLRALVHELTERVAA
jgi:uroporphyrinogen decarboxylase